VYRAELQTEASGVAKAKRGLKPFKNCFTKASLRIET
jgi:hypothetical protein